MYKLVALDIDGTLLNSEGVVTDETQDSIRRYSNKALITISTGRPIQGVLKYIELLEIEAPIITYNGAMIIDPITKKILFEQGLEACDARKIYELGSKMDTTITVWSNNRLYVNINNDNVDSYKRLSGVEPIVITDFEKIIEQGITKMLWIDEIDRVNMFQNILISEIGDSVNYCTSKPNFLEFFNKKVSKAEALRFIGKYLDIKQKEIIAIGDGNNDLAMIEYAGLGVAMENASDEVKDRANFITKSNNDDGIAYVLEKFIG